MDIVFVPVFFWQIGYLVVQLEFELMVGFIKSKLCEKRVNFLEYCFVFSSPRLDDEVDIVLSEVVFDEEVLGEFAAFLGELLVVAVQEEYVVEVGAFCPLLEEPILENKVVFLQDLDHIGYPLQLFLEKWTHNQLQRQLKLPLGCPLHHRILELCFEAELNQGVEEIADVVFMQFLQVTVLKFA